MTQYTSHIPSTTATLPVLRWSAVKTQRITELGALLYNTAKLIGTCYLIALISCYLYGVQARRWAQPIVDSFIASSLAEPTDTAVLVERMGATSSVASHRVIPWHESMKDDITQFTVSELKQYLGLELVNEMTRKAKKHGVRLSKDHLLTAITMDWYLQHTGEQH